MVQDFVTPMLDSAHVRLGGMVWIALVRFSFSLYHVSQISLNMHPFTEFDCPEDGLCSTQGTCDDSIGFCICNEGFEGNICKGEKTQSYIIFLIKFPICLLLL